MDDGFVHWDRSGQQQKTGAHRKDGKAERQQPRASDTRVPIVRCAVAQRLGFHDFPPIERKVIQGQTGALASSMGGPMQASLRPSACPEPVPPPGAADLALRQ